MKTRVKLIAILLAMCLLSGSLVACSKVDFASQVKLDMSAATLKQEVTVHTYVDGDTTHFNVPTSVVRTGVFKARYLAIDTPETTNRVEAYGKAAAALTRDRLENAESIYVESNDGVWNPDSSGSRYMVWVWYKAKGASSYKNLNIEVLQNGLAKANNTSNNRYGDVAVEALNYAKEKELNLYSGKPDPDHYYGEAIGVTLKELRCNISGLEGMRVSFEGVITSEADNKVYLEYYDQETDMYYGIGLYYGFTTSAISMLKMGYKLRVVASLQYYEAGNTYQVADVRYDPFKPNDPNNIQFISEGNEASYRLTTPATFLGKKTVIIDETEVEYDYAELAMNTTISMANLQVQSIYTTSNIDSSSVGAMTLTCRAEDNSIITIRTIPLFDEDGSLITEDAYKNKTIDVKGLVDYYDGTYQIKVFTPEDITIQD